MLESIEQIILPEALWREVVAHCRRKLAGELLPDESPGKKAYGLMAGVLSHATAIVERIFPLKQNVRGVEPFKRYMDRIMEEHAVPSKTPFSQRGWIADPTELKACYDLCDREEWVLFGTYHMHIVPWEHDPFRDTPTLLDTVLSQDSGLFSFIISMVDQERPRIRAFFEGDMRREVPLAIPAERKAEAG